MAPEFKPPEIPDQGIQPHIETAADVPAASLPPGSALPGIDLGAIQSDTLDITAPDTRRPVVSASVGDGAEAPRDAQETPAEQEPTGNTSGDTPPPVDVPPGETNPEEPNRGESLSKVLSFLERSPQVVREALEEAVNNHPDARERVTQLVVEEGVPHEDALRQAAVENRMEDDVPILQHATEAAAEASREQYADELGKVGLTLRPGYDEGLDAELDDPELFTEALRQTATPAPGPQRDAMHEKIRNVVQDALIDASATGLRIYPEEATGIVANDDSGTAASVRAHARLPLRMDDVWLHGNLTENSAAMAAELKRLQAPAEVVDALETHALAAEEGLEAEWAVGHKVGVAGRPDGRVGIDRIETPDQWNTAFQYLGYLKITAPEARFTQKVGEGLIQDIERVLDNPDIYYLDQPDAYRGRAALERDARPLLEQALIRARQIMGRD